MPESKVKQNVQNQEHTKDCVAVCDIFADLNTLKDRPENRRGPFIISDADLNEQFHLNDCVLTNTLK